MSEAYKNQITNEVGTRARTHRLIQVIDNKELILSRGELVAVGRFERIRDMAIELIHRDLLTKVVLIDIDDSVVQANRVAMNSDNIRIPTSVLPGNIETYRPESQIALVDWSNAYKWKGFRIAEVGQLLNNADIHFVSDFLNGDIMTRIIREEPISSFRELAGGYVEDFAFDPRTPKAIKESNSLLALATTISVDRLFNL
ncbi:hypothetical protein KC660_00500 [Candidatus Dojkabacteria bacterium]|uniref:Uncharacterized protein n=1 Tax=Candidatus Dojkabacteria bacterium TaxID=2099670 RepID=A0A955L2W9_9BACT|nr:hypothetical protein [Candidatus Dojkabacteria bacterium]